MAEKRGTKKPNLTVVQADSEIVDGLTAKERRQESLKKARAVRAANRARAPKVTGPSNLDRYRAGTYPCIEWEDEEVSKGRPRGRDGFAGPHPALTGRQQGEVRRELLRRGQSKFDSMYEDAIKVLHDVAQNGENESARVKAALAIKEMVAGKVPERIEIKSSDPWQDILDEVMTDDVLRPVSDQVAAQGN